MKRRAIGSVRCSVCGRRISAYRTAISEPRVWPHGSYRDRIPVESYHCPGSWKAGLDFQPKAKP